MSLEAAEFIRHFWLHILPPRYVKIRYYGLYGNRNRKETIQRCQALLGGGVTVSLSETESQSNPSNSQNKNCCATKVHRAVFLEEYNVKYLQLGV
jgi:hypothetical protein